MKMISDVNEGRLSYYKLPKIVGGMVHFEYDGEISEHEAKRLQYRKGFDPKYCDFTAFDKRQGRTYWRCFGKS